MLKIAIFFVVIFSLGFGFGSKIGPTPEENVEFIEVPHTKIIYRDAETPPTPVAQLPESCVLALSMAQDIAANAEHIYHSGEEQQQIITDTRIAIYDVNLQTLTTQQEAQQKLSGSLVGYLADMEEDLSTYETTFKNCKEDQ